MYTGQESTEGAVRESREFVGSVVLFQHEPQAVTWFMQSGDVIISVESFFKQVPSYENIQALEDGTVYYISFDELNRTYSQFPEFNIIGRVLTEKYYCQSEMRLFWLRKNKASDRYAYFLENYPEFIRKIPSLHIASFLGISQETLSRLKSSRMNSPSRG